VIAGRPAAPADGTAPPSGTPSGSDPATSVETRPRRRRRPGLVLVVAVLLLAALAAVLARPRTSTVPLHPDNPHPGGARAAAEILRRQGVDIRLTRTTAATTAAAADGGTVLVTDASLLRAEQWAALDALPADLVVTGTAYADLAPLTDAVTSTGDGGDGVRPARCEDPDARAAASISTGSGDVRALAPGVVVCFPSDASSKVGALAVVEDGDRRLVLLGNPRPLTNDLLDEAGNAALVLRLLGAQERLVWYVPSAEDATDPTAAGSALPPALPAVGGWALLVVVVAMVWRGRRLGRVVSEPLPVVVRPAEATLGRARLYRRAGAYGHAAEALRAGSAVRLARRLGVPPGAGPAELVAALARAVGRPQTAVADLLYGPAPTDDDALTALIRALDALEDEVDHP
jgi:hypothetical protein